MKPHLTHPSRSTGPHPSPSRRASRGFTLIEILVAMVVTSFGILGIVGMNATSIKLQSEAANRSRAALHAQDILDRMRANPVRARNQEYDFTVKADATLGQNPTIAQRDVFAWRSNLARTLPNGRGGVTVTAAGGATVIIQWTEGQNRWTKDPVDFTFTFNSGI